MPTSSDDSVRTFTNTVEGTLLNRPNRFVVVARTDGGVVVRAHCPNPGRLSEILVEDARLILERREPGSATATTDFTLVGAYYRGRVVPMFAARANATAERLVLPALFPDASSVEREVSVGGSRIDFRVREGRINHLVEVKAVTLVEEGVALFPDAPSLRAARHLSELAAAAEADRTGTTRSHVVFCVMQASAQLFAPNVHTDPAFATTLARCRNSIAYHAAVIETAADGMASITQASIPVTLDPVNHVAADSGCYVLQLALREDTRISVGALGEIELQAGFYLYVGSAQRGLSSRIARHGRKTRKTLRWHIDYLRARTDRPKTVRIYGSRQEAQIAKELTVTADASIPRFGAGDSDASSHLLYYQGERPPLERQDVVTVILRHQHLAALQAAE